MGDTALANKKARKTNSSDCFFKPKTDAQRDFYHRILSHPISFGVGAAGTGKSHVAVSCACEALRNGYVSKIIISRPAIEAGEKLGFLPGDMNEKLAPYVRPIYDLLEEIVGIKEVAKLTLSKSLEIAPLAFLRGRTFKNSFVLLDEAQNATKEQLLMFLSRIGEGSFLSITGDISQNDLGREGSGLQDAIERLYGINEISFTHFGKEDIVRHPLIGKIISRYEQA